MDPVKKIQIVEKILAMTNPDQRRRMLKDCLPLWNKSELKSLLTLRLDEVLDEVGDLKKLLKEPEKEEKILAMANADQQRQMLEDCLFELSDPELKRLLWLYTKEINDFNKLIREIGGRTVVPYEVD